MTQHNSRDPLTVLHGDDRPIQPDPTFAARLRAQLESAARFFADRPHAEGVVMSGTRTVLTDLTEPPAATPAPSSAAVPYLCVADARAAIRWYVEALGATPAADPVVMDDGRIGHAELTVADGVFYLADEYPELGLKAPVPQSVSVSLMLHVADTDAALQRARRHGAEVQRDLYEAHGTRNATIVDPFGHRWMLSGPVTGAPLRIQHGDIGYVAVWVEDPQRAARFYGQVLGWRWDPDSQQVTNTAQPVGIVGVPGAKTMFCCYAVTDLPAARQAIVEAGGHSGAPRDRDFGTVLEATDPLGTAFAVYQATDPAPRPALNGAGPGELSYVTFQVRDSAAFRDFYGRLLGWEFTPGHVEDGWQIEPVHPMSGVAGGIENQATVPMWTVDDVDAAVARVRDAGGTVIEEPAQQPYGRSAQCMDDQGVRFYLGQF
ncbi:VOC family protein [Mycolicibacterium thermoresistibile]